MTTTIMDTVDAIDYYCTHPAVSAIQVKANEDLFFVCCVLLSTQMRVPIDPEQDVSKLSQDCDCIEFVPKVSWTSSAS